jgi:O-antigen/teichoic acid export membrane protein
MALTNKISAVLSSSSARNVGKLLSANIIAQVIGFLIYPILTRMYAPEDFGLFNLFTSIVGVLTILATAEYQYAIVLPKEQDKARAIVHLSLILLLGTALIIGLTIPFARPMATLFNVPDLAQYWWLLPFSVLGLGLWNILSYWYIRRSAFTRVSGYQITQSLLAAGGKVSFGKIGWLQSGLIIASVLAPLVSLLISISLAWKTCIRELFTVDWHQLKAAAKEYANFPKFSLPRALVNTVSIALPVWFLTPAFGLEPVGQLSLAMLATVLPFSLFARACNQVLYQRISESVQQHQSIRHVLRTFVIWTSVAMIIGMTAVYIFLPQLVKIIFGIQWLESADIMRRLFPYLMLTPICGSICFLSDVFGKQKPAMWMETGYTVALVLVLALGVRGCTFLDCVSLFAWTKGIYLAIQLAWFIWLGKRYERLRTSL